MRNATYVKYVTLCFQEAACYQTKIECYRLAKEKKELLVVVCQNCTLDVDLIVAQ